MPYIYKITNDVNDKVYIGKTGRTVEERWKEHRKRHKLPSLNRPLYNAMRKHGVEHFKIEVIEECCEDVLSLREQFWIDVYNSYFDGYNATFGGDGKRTGPSSYNSQLVFDLFNQGKLVREIVELTGYSKPVVTRILDALATSKEIRSIRGHLVTSTPVMMIDLHTNEELRAFSSAHEATTFFSGNGHGHILEVCKGKRKTAYGYKWKFIT